MREEQEKYQEAAEASEKVVGLSAMPGWLRWSLTVFLILAVLMCLFLYVAYVNDPGSAASPADLGLSGLFIFCITALAAIHIPWHELGYRIKKVGAVEFEQTLNAQIAERTEVISYLEGRIAVIEDALEAKDFRSSEMYKQMYEPQLRKLLLDFLSANDRAPLSPLRIKEWGSTQPGFGSLKDFQVGFIRQTLGKLVAERVLRTTISEKGNTLYRIVE